MKPLPIWRRLLERPGALSLKLLPLDGEITLRRYLNARRVAREYESGATVLKSRPLKLVIEATNVCNLSCPGCLTGIGENGRVRSTIDQDLYRRVLDEIGDTLLQIEFYNWGEPLLCKSIYSMIEEASRRGISTLVSTNFSVPFDEKKAEALVRSGLKMLGVSMDGISQETYEQYRRGGDVELVKRNVRMVADAKQRLGSQTPHIVWSFHIFGHNRHEAGMVEPMAKSLGFDSAGITKGYYAGEDWEAPDEGANALNYDVERCIFLWHYAVIHNDGGVAPCCGSFYREDDMGRLAVRPHDLGEKSFLELWNAPSFRQARGLFREGKTGPEAGDKPEYLCTACPLSTNWWEMNGHLASGGARKDFRPRVTTHEGYNYFLNRRPPGGRDTRKVIKPRRERQAVADEV